MENNKIKDYILFGEKDNLYKIFFDQISNIYFNKNDSTKKIITRELKDGVLKIDTAQNFISIFNPDTGLYVRSNVYDEYLNQTNDDPFMASFPELIDIGVMGHCVHGLNGLCILSGVQCYQNGLETCQPNMSFENYEKIISECKGKVFQVALGGRGDVDQHENFEEIMRYTRINNIVPNFTSSGLGFNDDIIRICKEYAGAVAISWYRQKYTYKAIDMLLNAGIETNIHYVLGNNFIDEAISRLKNNDFPKGINAVVFLLHKDVGLGQKSNVLKYDDPKVKEFFSIIDNNQFDFKVGFDSCSIPGIINFTNKIDSKSIDTCEGGRFSMYITSDMKALPCSFDNQELRWSYDITNDSIENAWNSDQFNDFRDHLRYSCPECKNRTECYGGCPIRRNIVLCNKKERIQSN